MPRNSQGQLVGDFSDQRITPVGAGGFTSNIVPVRLPDNRVKLLDSRDVSIGGRRIVGEPSWETVFRADTMPAAQYDPLIVDSVKGDGIGTYCAAAAPSDGNFEVHQWNGRTYWTDNGRDMNLAPGIPPMRMKANGDWPRRTQSTIAIHPTTKFTWLLGSSQDGVRATDNRGEGSTLIASIPPHSLVAGQSAETKHYVEVDPTSGGDIWYAHSAGHGLLRSTSGVFGPYSVMPGSPIDCSCLRVCPTTGDVYVVRRPETTGNKLWRFDKAAQNWLNLPNTEYYDQVAIDPFNPDRLVMAGENGGLQKSLTRGQSWMRYVERRGSGEIGWISNSNKACFYSTIRFDPVVQDKIWMSDGVGVNWAMIPPETVLPPQIHIVYTTWIWHDYSRGNEMMCCFGGRHNP